MTRPPPIVLFLARHAAIGFAIAGVFVAGIVASDAAGLGTLLLSAAAHPFPLLMLWGFCGLTFASVQMGAAVMLLGEEEDDRRRGTGVPAGLTLRPVPVRVRAGARRRR